MGQIAVADGQNINYGGTGNPGGFLTFTPVQKVVTAIADNTATTVFTVTIPNISGNASIQMTLSAALGAGGAVGAFESAISVTYNINTTRFAGAAAVAGISSAFGSIANATSGAATITGTLTVTAVSGGATASNTFNIQTTIHAATGSATNHVAQLYGFVLNYSAGGVTIA